MRAPATDSSVRSASARVRGREHPVAQVLERARRRSGARRRRPRRAGRLAAARRRALVAAPRRAGMRGGRHADARRSSGRGRSAPSCPRPTSLSMRTWPPDCLTNPYTIDRPSPEPLPAVLGGEERLEHRSRCSGAMPWPVSLTTSRTYWPGASVAGRSLAAARRCVVSMQQPAALRHRVARVDDQIQQHALELVAVGERRPQSLAPARCRRGSCSPSTRAIMSVMSPTSTLSVERRSARAAAGG